MPAASNEDRLGERDWAMWHLYLKGKTQQAIADMHGLSQARVAQVIAEVRKALPPRDKDAIREDQLEQIRILRGELFDLIDADPAPVLYQGMDTGYVDHSPRLAAMDRLHKFHEREDKLLGLSAPTKVEGGFTVNYSVAGVDPDTDLT